ncbi:MAG: Serine/threonine protein kinase PrkC, regulator of stationary phase, partial [uncultured Solirubrobacterales bacterium]
MTSPAGTLRYADRYRVLRRLGAGGMATVFLAEDERLGREVAVKRLHADTPEDMARRFDREARLGASLNHPNLVTVFDTVVDPEGVLIVMEYVEGPTLSAALKSGPLEQARALEVLRETAAGLDYAHGLGIVHRDVKPANILLAERGQVKLADLGIAFVAERATHITRTGTVLGTPSYMAPEQLEGREVGPGVDVYALAAVAFEVLSGRKARTGGSPLEIAHRIATEPPPDVREAWSEAPAGLSQVLCKGMAFDPADRHASAGELAEQQALELGGAAGASTAASRRVRR